MYIFLYSGVHGVGGTPSRLPVTLHRRAAGDKGKGPLAKVTDGIPKTASGSEPHLPAYGDMIHTVRFHRVNHVPSPCIFPNMFYECALGQHNIF